MPIPSNQVFTDNFVRANTVTGAAGTTTGLGNNWTDLLGGVWNIASNTANNASTTSFTGTEASRPVAETGATNPNSRAVAQFTAVGTNHYAVGLRIQTNHDYYLVECLNNSIAAYRVVSGAASGIGTPLTTFPIAAGSVYNLDASIQGDGSTTTTVTVTVYNVTAATQSTTVTFTDTTTGALQAGGAVGLACNATGAAYSNFTSYVNTPPALSVANPTATVSANTITVTSATPANGTTPYKYQWYKSTAASFTPGSGNIITGATAISYVDSAATAGTRYSYIVVVTDSAATPATVTSNYVWFAAPSSVTSWGAVGDSITFGTKTTIVSSPVAFVNQLNDTLWPQKHIVNVQGVSGSATANWVSGSTNLNAAITAFQGASVTNIIIMLGTNDSYNSVTPATWLANMQNIIAALQAALAGVKIWVNASPFYDAQRYGAPYTAATLGTLDTYTPQIATLVSATVFAGDKTAAQLFAQRPEWSADGVHPNDSGAPVLGGLWAKNYVVTTQQGYGVAGGGGGIPAGQAIGNAGATGGVRGNS